MITKGRWVLIVSALALSAIVSFALSQRITMQSKAALHSEHPPPSSGNGSNFDFGSVRAGDDIEHTFQIGNPSGEPLEITNVSSTCGCTVAEVERRLLAPGESVPMLVKLSTKAKSGRVSQPVFVQLSDKSSFTYTLSGFVTNYEIAKLRFDRVLKGAAWQREVFLPWPPEMNLEIASVAYDTDKISVRHRAEQRRSVFQVSLNEQIPYGFMNEIVKIQTNDTLAPEKTISVAGMIAYPVECQPEQVTLGLIKPGQDATGKVIVFSPYARPIEIIEVAFKEGLDLAWVENRKSVSEIELTLTLHTDAVRAYYKSVLHVKARSEADTHEFDVEVYGVGATDGEAPDADSRSVPETTNPT